MKRTKLFIAKQIVTKELPTCHNVLETAIAIFCKLRIYRAIKVLNENIPAKISETKIRKYRKVSNI